MGHPHERCPGHPSGVRTVFDAFGRAVENYNGSSYTQFVYSPSGQKFAYMSGQGLLGYIMRLAGGVQEIYGSAGPSIVRNADWLGSGRLELTPAGVLNADQAYAPFGESYASSGTFIYSFTGQNKDTTGSQYDFQFRQLPPSEGRWLAPDPAGLAAVDLTNPQTWNRYAYVGNNPLNSIDPLGLDNDCGGPCTPFSFSYGNCTTYVSYHSETAPWGGSYDVPDIGTFCHGSGSVRSPGPLWTVADWDDVRGTGRKVNCDLTPLLCYRKPAGTPPQPNPVDCSKEPCVSSYKPPQPTQIHLDMTPTAAVALCLVTLGGSDPGPATMWASPGQGSATIDPRQLYRPSMSSRGDETIPVNPSGATRGGAAGGGASILLDIQNCINNAMNQIRNP